MNPQSSCVQERDITPLNPQIQNPETILNERYEYLLAMYKDENIPNLEKVLLELRQTLNDYDEISKEINLEHIKKREELSPSGKRYVNCVAVASALFCEKFRDHKVDMPIQDIIDSLHSNISTMLPYLSHGIVAVRMVEILLYDMCTIYHRYEDADKSWCSLATQCFNHSNASAEIKLASVVLICKCDVTKDFVDIRMFEYLQITLQTKRFLGFEMKYIEDSIARVEGKFTSGSEKKELFSLTNEKKRVKMLNDDVSSNTSTYKTEKDTRMCNKAKSIKSKPSTDNYQNKVMKYPTQHRNSSADVRAPKRWCK